MSEITITDVVFLTPARVSIEEDGTSFVRQVQVDLANRRIYDTPDHRFIWEDDVFCFLDNSNPLSSDFFAAPDEVSEKAQEAYDLTKNAHDQHVGGAE